MFSLAERLGKTVQELKSLMTSREYELWKSYDEVKYEKQKEAQKEAERQAKRR